MGHVTGRSGRRAACVLVAAACSVGGTAAAAGAADRVLIRNAGENVDAFRGNFAWSSSHNRLVLFSRGSRRLAPVRRFSGPVDPSLGPGRGGSPVAAYTRCKDTGPFEPVLGCDLFVLGLRSGRERKLRSLSSRRWSEYAIAAWRGRYLFARERCTRTRCRNGLWVTRPLRLISRDPVGDVDLRGGVAAFDHVDRVEPQSVRVVHLSSRGRLRQCVVGRVGDEEAPVSIALTRRFVYWVRAPGFEVLRRRIPTRRCIQRGPVQRLRYLSGNTNKNSVAITRGRVFYTDASTVLGRPVSLFQMTDPLVQDP
jgi:hypothetical protein